MQTCATHKYRAFSLAELMIAIVILGIGLLTVAAMFPIAWTKARDLSEFTNLTSITDSAEVTVRMLTRVTRVNPNPPPVLLQGSFMGDVVPPPYRPDPFVHALHLENMSVEEDWATGRTFPALDGPPRVGEWYQADYLTGAAQTDVRPDVTPGYQPLALPPAPVAPPPQVAFYQRVYPPLPPPPEDDGTSPASQHWQQLLRQRRLCWTVLHKLNFDVADPPLVGEPRTLTMYYVTLRRGQATHRFARQDPGDLTDPDPATYLVPHYGLPMIGDATMDAYALPAAEDVMFPVAWRVHITLVDSTPADLATIGLPGVPSQAMVTSTPGLIPHTADMVPRGSFLIDELTGDIYRVASHESDPSQPESAMLTFDEAIDATGLDFNGSITIEDEERLRTVWVFPPPIERDSGGALIGFAGPQPVVGIEVRTMVFWP